MLMDPEGPLAIRWRHLPALLPWARRLLRSATPEAVAQSEQVMAGLLAGARQAFDTLLAGTPAHATIRDRGELYVVRSRDAYRGFAAKIESCRRHGVAVQELDAADIRALEPLLAPDYRHGLLVPGSAWVDDPLTLSTLIHERFQAGGGRSERARVVSGQRDSLGRPSLQAADGRSFAADRLVIAAGSASARIAGWFGPRLPIEPQRGYHIAVPAGGAPLSGPVIEGEMSIAVTPMGGANRVAGTMEFAGPDAAPNWRRAAMLLPMARRMVPSLPDRIETRWYGDRPGTPDSVPVLGPRAGDDRIWYACGHGMLGLTLSARSGLLVAAAMCGDTQARHAMAGASPDRFQHT
jgi:D-amino-acid dehydrogenase